MHVRCLPKTYNLRLRLTHVYAILLPHMATNVQVEKNQNESSANVIRRFTKRVQNSGIVRRMRGHRYYARIKSENIRKESRLKKIGKAEAYEKMYKLGKIDDKRRR